MLIDNPPTLAWRYLLPWQPWPQQPKLNRLRL
jgi:hypothetical protein